MVRTGVSRAFGAKLRVLVGRKGGNRLTAFLSGLGVTALLQSSTATALIASSFAGRGFMTTATALAVLLGADVGTALVAQVLSFPMAWLASLCLFGGVITFLAGKATLWRDCGRILVGFGLMLLALRLIVAAALALRQSPALSELILAIAGEPVLGILVTASLTWLAHSSLAVILFVMSLAGGGTLAPDMALTLVLGANLGGVMPALVASFAEGLAARRVAVGNAAFRLIGVVAAAPFLEGIASLLPAIDANPARLVVDFHLAFNLVLAAMFLPLTGVAAALIRRLVPERPVEDDPGRPRYLDRSSLDTPSVALANAAREALRVGDLIETMLRQSMTALLTDDRKLVAEIERADNAVDRLNEAIKLHVTELTRDNLDEPDARRAADIITFATNLEHIGDIVDKNLMELAGKKIKNKRRFSEDGAAELVAFHRRVVENLQLALGVFISGDVKIARLLLDEKVRVRDAERAAAESHLARLREGRVESIDSSSLHLDVLRDLKRIHSHICSVAYPVLDEAGELTPTRLKAAREAEPVEARPAG